jgi:S-formylglutathione hydrolase FrmB
MGGMGSLRMAVKYPEVFQAVASMKPGVTFGVANQGSTALRDFATGTFAAFSDLKFELKSRQVATNGKSGTMEWVWRGRQTKDFPGAASN